VSTYILDEHFTQDGMAKQRIQRQRTPTVPTPFEEARDELFQQIMRCGVIGADTAHQDEWFRDTMAYLGDRYHELSPTQTPRTLQRPSGT
jgi:hypothetical protein